MSLIEKRLALLSQHSRPQDLRSRIGLEKESLRTTLDGSLAQTPHPTAWGAPLTHPQITTDYAEALTEFITPPLSDIPSILEHLRALHTYAYQAMPHEMFWAASMPSRLPAHDQIPVADYGTSNLGRMKQLYRIGLGHRYGRAMQVIAGIHFNWSMPPTFWPWYQQALNLPGTAQQLRDTHYMGLVRNLIRYGWLTPYLFGASPAVSASFFEQPPAALTAWDTDTYYHPQATSLRMGDIGYQNSTEAALNFQVDYNSVLGYATSLLQATTTPAAPWQRIGVQHNGQYRQLNANILQIENEYYSIVRPKQLTQGLESPTVALIARGINHIELRALDLNLTDPLGVNAQQLYFLDAFMLTYLLADSPPLTAVEQTNSRHNLLTIAHRGRATNLHLRHQKGSISHCDWGSHLLRAMEPVCHWLDQQHHTTGYTQALTAQQQQMQDPSKTPASIIWDRMQTQHNSFHALATHYATQHRHFFQQQTLSAAQQQQFSAMRIASEHKFAAIEAHRETNFDQFLADYFASVARAAGNLGPQQHD